MNRRRLLGVLAGLLLALGIGLAGPASAHALLLTTTPGIGSESPVEPTTVTLTFDSAVIGSPRAIVVTANGQRLDDGQPVHPGGDASALSVRIRPGPDTASYNVLWRVGSADGHAVDGSFSFGVGEPAGPAPPLSSVTGSRFVQVVDTVAQAAAYVGLILSGGIALLVGLLWPATASQSRVRFLIAGGWGMEVTATVGLFLLRGPVTAGTGVSTLLHGFDDTLATRSGRLLLARLVLLFLLLPALRRLLGRESGATIDLAILVGLICVSFPLGDHAGDGSDPIVWVFLGSVHVLAAALWLGGLTLLAVVLLRPGQKVELRGWSLIAATCVIVLVVTGVLASVREVGGWAALTSTSYGRTLITKVVVITVLLGFAELARRGVRHRAEPTSLRRGVVVEALLGVGVLVLTAGLVATEPARDSYPVPVTLRFSLTPVAGTAEPLTAVVHIDSSRVGPETLTVSLLDNAGTVPTLISLDGLLADHEHEDDPLRFPFVMGTPGHGIVSVELPEIGRWRLNLQARGGDGVRSDRSGQASYIVG